MKRVYFTFLLSILSLCTFSSTVTCSVNALEFYEFNKRGASIEDRRSVQGSKIKLKFEGDSLVGQSLMGDKVGLHCMDPITLDEDFIEENFGWVKEYERYTGKTLFECNKKWGGKAFYILGEDGESYFTSTIPVSVGNNRYDVVDSIGLMNCDN